MNYIKRADLIPYETLTLLEKTGAAHYKDNGGETAATLVQGAGAYFKGFYQERRLRAEAERQFTLLKECYNAEGDPKELEFTKIDDISVSDIIDALFYGPIAATGLHWSTMKAYMVYEGFISSAASSTEKITHRE